MFNAFTILVVALAFATLVRTSATMLTVGSTLAGYLRGK